MFLFLLLFGFVIDVGGWSWNEKQIYYCSLIEEDVEQAIEDAIDDIIFGVKKISYRVVRI